VIVKGKIGEGGLKGLFFVLPNLRNIYITQCHLQLHCKTKRSCKTFGDFSPNWDSSRIFSESSRKAMRPRSARPKQLLRSKKYD